MAWIYLIIASLFEILGVIIMKEFVNTKKNKFLLFLMLSFSCSFAFLSLSMQSIPMSIAYAIWTGFGTAGGVIISIVFYKEDKSFLKLFFIFVIFVCVISLKMIS